MTRYTTDDLITKLEEFADDLGEVPTQRDVDNDEDMPSSHTYKNRFGSWNDALREAGFNPKMSTPDTDPSRDELLTKLEALADELGKTPTTTELRDADDMPSIHWYKKEFGSWNDAVRAAGLEPNTAPAREMDDEELLDQLREFAEELGRTPRAHELSDADQMPSSVTYQNRFGSWNEALLEAGLQPASPSKQRLSNNELLDRLQDLAEELGEVPGQKDVNEADDLPQATTYRERFGSFEDALIEAGVLAPASN